MKKIRIGKGRVLPIAFSLVGTIALFGIFIFMFEQLPKVGFIIGAIVISPLLPLMWTSRYIIEIDPDEKYIWEYIWLMGKKIGRPISYASIEKIYINKVKMSQRMTSWGGQVRTNKTNEFVGFIKFESGKTVELIREQEKEFVFEELAKIAKKLETELVDQTDR
jgi:hypothetical protein